MAHPRAILFVHVEMLPLSLRARHRCSSPWLSLAAHRHCCLPAAATPHRRPQKNHPILAPSHLHRLPAATPPPTPPPSSPSLAVIPPFLQAIGQCFHPSGHLLSPWSIPATTMIGPIHHGCCPKLPWSTKASLLPSKLKPPPAVPLLAAASTHPHSHRFLPPSFPSPTHPLPWPSPVTSPLCPPLPWLKPLVVTHACHPILASPQPMPIPRPKMPSSPCCHPASIIIVELHLLLPLFGHPGLHHLLYGSPPPPMLTIPPFSILQSSPP